MGYILVIEDDSAISDLISYNLKQERFDVSAVPSAEEGLRAMRQRRPDLIVLDIMLPGMSGLELCRRLRAYPQFRDVPVIMLTAKAEEVDRIVGFEVGADDYVTKPFSPRELVLRIRSVLKRGETKGTAAKTLKFKDMVIDPASHSAFIGRKELGLTLMEFKLLSYLLENKDRVLGRDAILDNVWGYSADVFSRTVDTHITRLREKLGPYSRHLRSVRGLGYIWKDK